MCMIDDSDGSTTILSERYRQARKSHRCSECYRTIRAGERYLAETCLFEGEITRHKTCSHCEVVREWLVKECSGFLYGGIGEDIAEHAHSGYYGFGVARLAAGMRSKWVRKTGLLWPIPHLVNGKRAQHSESHQ